MKFSDKEYIGLNMELHNILVGVVIISVVLAVIVFAVLGIGRRKRLQQQQRARETARKLYGVGKPRYKPHHKFLSNMRIVISKFKYQRHESEYQFAVMFFVDQEIKRLEDIYVDGNFTFWTKDRSSLCNYNNVFWPDTDKFYNYMVARHENLKHAEEFLLERFPVLWANYTRLKRRKKPSFVVLYSWIMPCSRCTDMFKRTAIEDMFKPTQFVVAYTTPAWNGEPENTAEINREKLLSVGTRVYHVTYDKYLPPGEQPVDDSSHQIIQLSDEEEFPPLQKK